MPKVPNMIKVRGHLYVKADSFKDYQENLKVDAVKASGKVEQVCRRFIKALREVVVDIHGEYEGIDVPMKTMSDTFAELQTAVENFRKVYDRPLPPESVPEADMY